MSVQLPDPLADVSVSVCVAPGIQAQFDAVKVARLIRHVNTIVSTIQEAMYPTQTHTHSQSYTESAPQGLISFDSFSMRGDGSTPGPSSSIVTAAMRDMGTEGSALLSPEGFIAPGQTPPSTHCFVDVTVDLPLISIELLVSDCHSVTLSVTRVETHVLVRQNDLQVYFAVGTLLLVDSLRGKDRESIIFTPPLSVDQQKQQKRHKQRRKLLLSPSTTTGTVDSSDDLHLKDKERGYSFDLELPSTSTPSVLRDSVHRFGCDHLTSSLISVTYTFLYTRQSPLFRHHGQELSIEFSSLGVSIDEEAVRRLKPFVEMLAREMKSGEVKAASSMVPGVGAASSAPVVAAVGPIGLLVTVSIGSVSLTLMRAQDIKKAPTHMQAHVHAHSFTPIRVLSSPSILEESYSVEVTDLYSMTDMRHSTAADVRLRSFTVKDCRPVSRGYVYKEMLCRSTLGSEHNSEGHSSIGRKRNAQGPKTRQDDDSDILTIAYREESKHAGTVEVEVRNIASFIAVDSVVELAAVATLNVAAVMEVCVALLGQTAVEDEERGRVEPARSDADYPYSVPRSAQSSPFSAAVSGKYTQDPLHGTRARPGSAESEKDREREGRRGVVPLIRQRSVGPRSRISGERAMSFNGNGNSNTNTPTRADRSGVQTPVNSTGTAPFLLNAIVSVVSPRLLLLEDPESADSRAIVVRSGVSVHYCNNAKPDTVTMETLHISLQTLEVFALTGLTQGRPQQIGEIRLFSIQMLCK